MAILSYWIRVTRAEPQTPEPKPITTTTHLSDILQVDNLIKSTYQWSCRAGLKTFLLGVWVVVIMIIGAEQGTSYATDSAAVIFKGFPTFITKDHKIYLP